MKRIFIFLAVTFTLTSCVSESEHQKIVDEKNTLSTENQNLKTELEEIKFGAPNLLSDGKKFYQAKDFSQARQKFQTLLQKHPDMPQSIEAKNYLSNIDEEELWQNAFNSEEISNTEDYQTKRIKNLAFQ